MDEEAGEQRRVGAGLEAEEQIDIAGGVGTARVDHDHARAALPTVLQHALEQHGMAPGRIRADEDEQVGLVEILVAAGHGVGAEGAAMARN